MEASENLSHESLNTGSGLKYIDVIAEYFNRAAQLAPASNR